MAGLNGLNTKANKYKFYTLTIFPEATPREGWGTLICSYIRRLGPFFLCFKILNFNIFGGFQKKNFFWDMKILLISILGHHKIGLDLGVISMHSRFFYLRSRYRIRVARISKIFFEGGRVA